MIILGWIFIISNLIINKINGYSDYTSFWGYLVGSGILLIGLTESHYRLKKKIKKLEDKEK